MASSKLSAVLLLLLVSTGAIADAHDEPEPEPVQRLGRTALAIRMFCTYPWMKCRVKLFGNWYRNVCVFTYSDVSALGHARA